jgi:siderophore synthetase component
VPCHPHQARALAARGDLGDAVVVGELGEAVRPTSSVRTVRLPGGDHWKLALDVQVTNFVRRNTRTEVRRALDAARVLAALDPGGHPLGTAAFEVLLETGVRAVGPPAGGTPGAAPPGPADDDLFAATAALHRPAPGPGPVPIVVAALLEPDVVTGRTPLGRLVRRAAAGAGTTPARLSRPWLRAYLGVSLRPLLRLLVTEGVSMEAHPQNALAGFVGGWPRRLVVRDLEGTSIDSAHPRAAHHRQAIGRAASPVLYAPEDAWRRFAYHVVVNHVGHVVATLALEADADEASLWPDVAAAVAAEAAGAPTPAVAARLAEALLGPTLPAKANLLSTLLGRADRPVYVPVPTPYATSPGPAAAADADATRARAPARASAPATGPTVRV